MAHYRPAVIATQRPRWQRRIPQPLGKRSRARAARQNPASTRRARDNQPWVLSQLTIRNFAIVDLLEIDWHTGLNVITGETGAGKSILIDAVGALLGDRLGPEVVRSGAQRALIEGIFMLPGSIPAELSAAMDEFGLEPEDGALIISREIAGAGG